MLAASGLDSSAALERLRTALEMAEMGVTSGQCQDEFREETRLDSSSLRLRLVPGLQELEA